MNEQLNKTSRIYLIDLIAFYYIPERFKDYLKPNVDSTQFLISAMDYHLEKLAKWKRSPDYYDFLDKYIDFGCILYNCGGNRNLADTHHHEIMEELFISLADLFDYVSDLVGGPTWDILTLEVKSGLAIISRGIDYRIMVYHEREQKEKLNEKSRRRRHVSSGNYDS